MALGLTAPPPIERTPPPMTTDAGRFYPRSAWTDHGPARPLTPFNIAAAAGLAVHWPGTTTDDYDGAQLPTLAATVRRLRAWRDYHVEVKRWADIAYQVAIDQAGRIIVLRGLSNRSAANGNEPANEHYGAVLLILGDQERPSPSMLLGFHTFYVQAWRARGGDPNVRTHDYVRRHYGLGGTDCPGPIVSGLIKAGTLQ